ncbi:hypothetical protein EZV62_015622 [Acer yangbiense]|uniref:Cupin type-1 domain-containing protein n=1 Tax=Acer yangbiense TaxID=1000413 RepID=A0A5C7HLC9_9ROSI|nr:hypothetical protein EZV62_015622 [Acer yangbiense]
MANPRRNSYSENPFNTQNLSSHSYLINLCKRPLAFPILLLIFVLVTWVSFRLQYSSYFFNSSHKTTQEKWSSFDDDDKANLVRFLNHHHPSLIVKDNRGWLLDPISLALQSHLKGGAISCASLHLGEIRAGGLRGNHRHYTVNETFVIWGAKTKFRLENNQTDKGYAEVIVGADEVAVAASPSGTAHALVNVDPILSTFFIGCQDGVINYNNSNSDFNVWKDL